MPTILATGGTGLGLKENPVVAEPLMTDSDPCCVKLKNAGGFVGLDAVDHSANEHVRDGYISTNTIEGYYSIFKRGMKGVHRHCGEKLAAGIVDKTPHQSVGRSAALGGDSSSLLALA